MLSFVPFVRNEPNFGESGRDRRTKVCETKPIAAKRKSRQVLDEKRVMVNCSHGGLAKQSQFPAVPRGTSVAGTDVAFRTNKANSVADRNRRGPTRRHGGLQTKPICRGRRGKTIAKAGGLDAATRLGANMRNEANFGRCGPGRVPTAGKPKMSGEGVQLVESSDFTLQTFQRAARGAVFALRDGAWRGILPRIERYDLPNSRTWVKGMTHGTGE